MNIPVISVIVPVYNVANYLSRCLYSLVLSSNREKQEIIIVNDGSTDNSLVIAEEFQQRFPELNIQIISQANQGLSVARNTGMNVAQGEYLAFIDSDDFVDSFNFEELIHQTVKENLDIGIGRFCYWGHTGIVQVGDIKADLIDKEPSHGRLHLDVMRPEVWCKIYRRQFLLDNNINFIPYLIHEDEVFNFHTMLLAERVKQFDIPFYFYYQRTGSIMSNVNRETRALRFIRLAEEILPLRTYVNEQDRYRVVARAWFFFSEAFYMLYNIQPELFERKRLEYQRLLREFLSLSELYSDAVDIAKSWLINEI